MTRKVNTADFFRTQPVFSLDEATRGVYAVVPPGVDVEMFRSDPVLVAAVTTFPVAISFKD